MVASFTSNAFCSGFVNGLADVLAEVLSAVVQSQWCLSWADAVGDVHGVRIRLDGLD